MTAELAKPPFESASAEPRASRALPGAEGEGTRPAWSVEDADPRSRTGGSAYRPAFFSAEPVRKMTFDNLMPFAKNRALLKTIRSIATVREAAIHWLFVHAREGAGKTHLLSACADLAAQQDVLLVNLVELDAEIRRADRLGSRATLRALLGSVDLLLLDDVHLARDNRVLQRELLAVLDRRLGCSRATVIASLFPPGKLKGIEPQVCSRLAAGPVVRLEVGDTEERFQLLRTLVPDRELSDNVLRYLAEQVENDIRRLTAASQQLRLAQVGLDEPITREIARAMVPAPEDMQPALRRDLGSTPRPTERLPSARYREMLAAADTRDEEILALQIAVSDRLRCRRDDDDDETVKSFGAALEALREGDMESAIFHLQAAEASPP